MTHSLKYDLFSPPLMDFVDGLADDAEAIANGGSESWSNGMATERA